MRPRAAALSRPASVVFAIGLACATVLAGEQTKETAEQLRVRTFERVWQIVNERFYDPHFNGVNWREVRVRYAPRVSAVRGGQEFYDTLNEMLGELKQSHMHVFAPWEYSDRDSKHETSHVQWASLLPEGANGPGNAGMTVQVVEGRPVVTRVEKGSAAAAVGIQAGFVLQEVGGLNLEDELREVATAKARLLDRDRELAGIAEGRLAGYAGEELIVKVLDAQDKQRVLTLTLKTPRGEPSSFGEMPTLYADLEARRLPSGVGYLRFNAFLMPLIDRIKKAIDSFQGAKGIVIDLRGNPGGIGGIALPIAGRLSTKPTLLGISRMRSGEARELAYPQAPCFNGPVAILIDECSASTSEMLAGGLQECGRAIVVGRTSAGAVLPCAFEKLPDGARLQYVVAVFHTPKGVLLEGRGVVPDLPVAPTRRALLAGVDPVLDRAVAALMRKG